eukprot:scaffold78070_cov23-Tisochrysis_lutea.AAC.4
MPPAPSLVSTAGPPGQSPEGSVTSRGCGASGLAGVVICDVGAAGVSEAGCESTAAAVGPRRSVTASSCACVSCDRTAASSVLSSPSRAAASRSLSLACSCTRTRASSAASRATVASRAVAASRAMDVSSAATCRRSRSSATLCCVFSSES